MVAATEVVVVTVAAVEAAAVAADTLPAILLHWAEADGSESKRRDSGKGYVLDDGHFR